MVHWMFITEILITYLLYNACYLHVGNVELSACLSRRRSGFVSIWRAKQCHEYTHISLNTVNTYIYIYSEIQHTYKHSYMAAILAQIQCEWCVEAVALRVAHLVDCSPTRDGYTKEKRLGLLTTSTSLRVCA